MGNGDREEPESKNDGHILNHMYKENIVYSLQRTLFFIKGSPLSNSSLQL